MLSDVVDVWYVWCDPCVIHVWSMNVQNAIFRTDFWSVKKIKHRRKDRLRLLRRHGTTKLLKVRHNRQSFNIGMDQYLLIPFLGGWTSIYHLFWCSPGVQGFDTLPYINMFHYISLCSIEEFEVISIYFRLLCEIPELKHVNHPELSWLVCHHASLGHTYELCVWLTERLCK